MMVENYIAKRSYNVIFLDLEKASEGVDWNALWEVLKFDVEGNCLMQQTHSTNFFRAFVKVDSRLVKVLRQA